MSQLLRTNPGLLVWLILFGSGALVCLVISSLMSRSGASLRPIWWFAGFFLLIGVPQFCAHLWLAVGTLKREAPRVAALQQLSGGTEPEARTAAAKLLFGPDVSPALVTDARAVFGEALANAEVAQFAVLPNGDSVLLARFAGYSAAERAWVAYLRVTGLNQLGGQGDSQRGYAVTRPAGDRAYVLHQANLVGVWTGADDAAIRARMLAGGFKIPRRAPLANEVSQTSQGSTSAKPDKRSPVVVLLSAVALVAYLLLVVAYFFKGAAWAGSVPPKATAKPLSAAELTDRLEAINALEVPFRIERGTHPGEFFATWRYADAKWVDLARARGLRRTFRIRLTLDEAAQVVRATDYAASHDWSIGRGGASFEWRAGLGIVFFQQEHQRVFGLQLDDQGRFKPELSYAYSFNLHELKSPLIAAVTRAGWTWRPTVWQGPASLRWLTE
jgi:hypothetical protein